MFDSFAVGFMFISHCKLFFCCIWFLRLNVNRKCINTIIRSFIQLFYLFSNAVAGIWGWGRRRLRQFISFGWPIFRPETKFQKQMLRVLLCLFSISRGFQSVIKCFSEGCWKGVMGFEEFLKNSAIFIINLFKEINSSPRWLQTFKYIFGRGKDHWIFY